MNKFERIQAALDFAETDRIPVSLWSHYSAIDQDPRALAEAQVADNLKYDFDFIKLMPFGLYPVQDWGVRVKFFCRRGCPPVVDDYVIHSPGDWDRVNILPPTYGTYGKTLELTQYASHLTQGRIPFAQTIFSPLTVAFKLAGERILLDMKEHSSILKKALEAITETTVHFVEANIESGAPAIFMGTQCAAHDLMTEEEYEEFGVPYDLQVIESYRGKVFFDSFHLHGDNVMFDLIERYPVKCLNWHSRSTWPGLAEARRKTRKCFMGGLQEQPLTDEEGRTTPGVLNAGSVADVEQHVRKAITEAGERGLIISPSCGMDQFVPERNIFAVRRAVA
jgi:uroporphyrinogen decarboxylase